MPKPKKKYLTVGFRVSDEENRYLRREASERGIKVSKYLKAILFPAWPSKHKNND